ncbi:MULTISPECIES: SDR family oxidoreductase [unclassified Rhizobium]|uniref:SDR family oxidoreductase n=1 Tax=unclassified Rhizobium TaxID=2613769 RepID=UPI001ADA7BDF|nr:MULTISPECIES: SDR family oxidoreductase [unclassified Rhizobium]MBO9123746.1 SDR family oxidoreductase [Rhizobium sp. 16-488-2b]MBO9174278.1 SDR family oxidoreductase [Rhizobium sp. 16-488-2a]
MNFHQNTISVVVGGNTGIGRAVADELSKREGRVIIASRRSGLDVADPEAVERYFSSLGPIDHLVFTAGSQAPGGKLVDVDLADAKAAFDTKFWGSLAVAKAASRQMRDGGTITFTTGFLARRTVPNTFVKTAMNSALEAVAKILARELSPIRVNVVSPGLTDTEAYEAMDGAARQAMLERAAANLPAGRYGRAEDVARGYLLAIDNPFMTGAVIDIDGGALVN